jgi:serine/threonine-protein kinase RsbW
MNAAPSTLRMPAQLASVRPLCEFATAALGGASASQRALSVELAVEEILVNIVRYGYSGTSAGEIDVTRAVSDGALMIEISDSGNPFDPFARAAPDLDAPLQERSIGGLGIFLAKNLAATAEYRRSDGRNIVELRFDVRISDAHYT